MSSNQEDRLKQRAESLTDSSAESDDDQEQMEKETPTPNTVRRGIHDHSKSDHECSRL